MYARRRRRLLEAMGPDAVAVLIGARRTVRSADTHFPFRQDSDFLYLTGFDHPDAVAVLRSVGEPRFLLFVEPRDPESERWTGERPGVEGACERYGADEAYPIGELHERLPGLIEGARVLFHVLGRDPRIDQRIVETLENQRLRSRAGIVPPERLVDPRNLIHEMRLHKEPAEIDRMRRAAAITCAAHRVAAARIRSGSHEYEVAAEIEYRFRLGGASGPAYETIVGSGPNATVLHYVANRRRIEGGELVLVDAGCEFEGYAADVTRTYPSDGRFTPERRALYETVLAAQRAALGIVRPGVTLEQVHQAALDRLIDGMIELGLLEGSREEAIENQAYRRFYMHRTSHWLGLDVHDVGTYVHDGKPRPLEPGMVFTVEPGLYVPPDEDSAPAALRGVGVRIEDDVLVTAEGCEVLTAELPKEPEELEALVAAR